jgi:hypothetical protein
MKCVASPKHSELEPDYRLAKGDGTSTSRRRLSALNFKKMFSNELSSLPQWSGTDIKGAI